MSDSVGLLPFVDKFQLDECYGWLVREEKPTTLEYVAAEFWIREKYRQYFRKLPSPQIITWQYERFFTGYETGNLVIEAAMETLDSDFRNGLSDSFVRRFHKIMRNGHNDREFLDLLKEASSGGALKPDMLGIYADNTVLAFDAVEVGTVKTAKPTYDELHKKLEILRSRVLPITRLKVEHLAQKYYKRGLNISPPLDYRASASAFRPDRDAWILPLPVRISTSGNARYADWICFHPSKSWRPKTPAPSQDELPNASTRPGTDGLLIYHIHRATLPNLPDPVRRHVDRELRAWRQSHGLTLELNPAFAAAMHNSRSSWSPEALQLFGYAGAGALLVMFMAVAWESGLIAGGAAIGKAGLVALAESPQILFGALRSAGQISQQLWPAAIGAASLMPAPP